MSEKKRQPIDLNDLINLEKLEEEILEAAGDEPIYPSDYANETRPPEVEITWWRMLVKESIDHLETEEKLVSLYYDEDVFAVPGRHRLDENGDPEEIKEPEAETPDA